MKNIELTKDHKSKLLEMCEKLFPEYNYNKKTGYGGWSIGENYSHSHLIGYLKNDFNDSIDDPDIYIHWFEFCMTYLLDKICPDNNKQGYDNWSIDYSDKDLIIISIIINKKHPIDILYKTFKK